MTERIAAAHTRWEYDIVEREWVEVPIGTKPVRTVAFYRGKKLVLLGTFDVDTTPRGEQVYIPASPRTVQLCADAFAIGDLWTSMGGFIPREGITPAEVSS